MRGEAPHLKGGAGGKAPQFRSFSCLFSLRQQAFSKNLPYITPSTVSSFEVLLCLATLVSANPIPTGGMVEEGEYESHHKSRKKDLFLSSSSGSAHFH